MASETTPRRILYSDVSSHTVHALSTEPPLVDFSKSDIKTLYVDLKIPGTRIADIIGVNMSRIYSWLKTQEIEIRPIHTQESNARRGAAHRRLNAENQTYRSANLARLELAWEANRKKGEASKQRKINEKSVINISRAREILESPKFFLLSLRQQEILTYRYRLDGSLPRRLREVGEHFGKITLQRVSQIEQAAFRVLFPKD
jgi:hypothetical protein